MIVLILYIQNSQIHRSRKYNRVCQGAAERRWELFTDLGFILDLKKNWKAGIGAGCTIPSMHLLL